MFTPRVIMGIVATPSEEIPLLTPLFLDTFLNFQKLVPFPNPSPLFLYTTEKISSS